MQRMFVNARFVYASATVASSPKELEYMQRVGLFGPASPFETFGDFEKTVEARGTGAMELLAVELKRWGRYIARTLSFEQASRQMQMCAHARTHTHTQTRQRMHKRTNAPIYHSHLP